MPKIENIRKYESQQNSVRDSRNSLPDINTDLREANNQFQLPPADSKGWANKKNENLSQSRFTNLR